MTNGDADETKVTQLLRLLRSLGAVLLLVGLLVGIVGIAAILHEKGFAVRFSIGGLLAALGVALLALAVSFTALHSSSWSTVDPISQILGFGFVVGGLTFAVTSNVSYLVGSWAISVVVLLALTLAGIIRPRA